MQPKVIKVAKVPESDKSPSWQRTLATLCYFYPQYTFAQARKLPYRRVVLLINEARRQEAARYYNLTQIAAAPHMKNSGEAVKTLLNDFESTMNGE